LKQSFQPAQAENSERRRAAMNLPNDQMALRNAGSGSGQRALMSPSRARRSSSQGLNHQTLEPAKSQGLNHQTLQPVVTIEMARRTLERAGAPAEWGVTAELFQTALERSATHRFQAGSGESRGRTPGTREVEQYLSSLNAAELALACACAAGIGAAWDHFMAKFRPELYRAAGAIAARSGGGDAAARDLADSLYAELYGLRDPEGQRKSLLDYYHGRSKLSTWLHAILAQRHVDEIRRSRKTESLDEPAEEGELVNEPAAPSSAPDPEREGYLAMLQAALTATLGALPPRDRLRMAYYYAQDLTLAQIGRLMREHESTVSRQLERTRKDIRKAVESALRQEKKLSEAQLKLCFEYAQEEWPFDLTLRLRSGTSPPVVARE
jgi:RNA polymerase sigma-70 factor (ECF subfamily)